MPETSLEVVANELGHMREEMREVKDEMRSMSACITALKVSQGKLIGLLSAVGVTGGAAGAGIVQLLGG